MKVVALDFGAKRIGLAAGDTETQVAFPRGILLVSNSTSRAYFSEIQAFCERERAEKILVGHPGKIGEIGTEQALLCRQFADDLEDFLMTQQNTIPVEFVDEAFSTQMATEQLKNLGLSSAEQRGEKDALAAAAFLQRYLDEEKN